MEKGEISEERMQTLREHFADLRKILDHFMRERRRKENKIKKALSEKYSSKDAGHKPTNVIEHLSEERKRQLKLCKKRSAYGKHKAIASTRYFKQHFEKEMKNFSKTFQNLKAQNADNKYFNCFSIKSKSKYIKSISRQIGKFKIFQPVVDAVFLRKIIFNARVKYVLSSA